MAGEQTHVHVIIIRTENPARYSERQRADKLTRKNPYHFSLVTYHKGTQ
ncbi:hypothetical protein GO988_22965 [Hymenobacter sp. HMF4947]|uniref:Uncharacterized protein n=1 Tax=Hymenobacter ginkgonis TaxID=2682976 RepID=A0A7K1TLF7_9BACT|nr:hypothetical protein [Hymenobacter ginkgonis]MVN79203.1 hypothetical protein [Hymenobacter ginkgonis]